MKQYGILGKGSGKLGSSVFAISGGEQIVRQYNPVVSNPNTPAQVAQRAKLKLMSQIAADLAPVIAIPKDGLKSSRNIFVSKNIGFALYDNDEAHVDVTKLQITPGSAPIGQLSVERDGSNIVALIQGGAPDDITEVVYALYEVGDDFQLSLIDSAVVTEPGQNNEFLHQFASAANDGVIFAYGVRGGVTGSGVAYGNYDAGDATGMAQLAVTRKLKNAASTLTKTEGFRFYFT